MKPLESAAATDPGQRPHNEDYYLLDDEAGLYVVADGVGGREAGEVASRLTCETIDVHYRRGESLPDAIRAAHAAVRAAVAARQDSKSSGMASTAVALQLDGRAFRIAWAGDSKAFFWSGDTLQGLTRDHSLVEQLISRGEVDRAKARDHPQKNVILSAVGGDRDGIQIDENAGVLSADGVFILCSDGLSDVLSHETISEIIGGNSSLEDRAQQLTLTAKEAGGRDNITTLLVAYCEAETEGTDAAGTADAAVYERYDSRTKELSWPLDGVPRTPTVQRVRARKPGEQTGPSLPAPVAAARERPEKEERRRGSGARVLALALMAAATIAAGLLYLESTGAITGN